MAKIWFRALYNDNTHFEWDETGGEKKGHAVKDYEKIDRSKLIAFEINQHYPTKCIHRLWLEPGQRLIFRRRNLKKINVDKLKMVMEKFAGLPESKIPPQYFIHSHVYLVGYQETIKGVNRKAITIIFEDGHTELISEWKNEPAGDITFTLAEKTIFEQNLPKLE